MPVMNGIEMISKIRKVNKSIVILVLSAYNEASYMLETIKEGIEGYILKPIITEQFIDLLEKLVNNFRMKEELSDYQQNLELKVEEQTKELKEHYYHDSLTGLDNFLKLEEYLKTEDYSTLYILDITKFSVVFKQFGLIFTSNVLKEVARNLSKHINPGMRLFKIESDKFAILTHHTNPDEIKDYCRQIVSYYDNSNIEVEDVELNITFSLGITDINDSSDPLVNGEYALSNAKLMGARFCSFSDLDQTLIEQEKEKIRWLSITKTLIEEENIIPYYQAIVDVKSKETVKYEVLARGIVDGEIVAPFMFLEAAEQLGLMSSITKIIIQKSFQFFANTSHHFSLNIAQRDLLEGYLPEFLAHKLEAYQIEPSSITLEILENITLLSNSDAITKQLDALKDMGFEIAIDDFGVENSNFGRLVDINIDTIKIDGFFIKDVNLNLKDQKIVKAIVNLAKALGIKTVAEFVETEEVYNIISELEVDYAQGYYFSRPNEALL